MLAHPMKRARSNSPPTSPNGISSPLDILLKRRRRNELIESLGWGGQEGLYLPTQQQSESGHGDWQVSPDRRRDEDENVNGIAGPSRFACHGEFAADHPTISDGSRNIESTEMGVERRRRRQWEKAQAPPPYYYNPSGTSHRHSQGTSETPPNPASFHSPIPINNSQSHGNNGYDRNQSNGRHEMSSSPIRNHPPGSSPFRANVAENGHGNEGYGDLDWEHEMSIEEMRREWGDEYASQNTLLHSLHMARIQNIPHNHPAATNTPTHSVFSSPYPQPIQSSSSFSFNSQSTTTTRLLTPNHPALLHTGSHETPDHHQPFETNYTPSELTPYRHLNSYFPSSSPSLDSSSTLLTKTEYSTPFHPDVRPEGEADMDMITTEMEEDVRARYEETNRLLAELAVARRRRWGDSG